VSAAARRSGEKGPAGLFGSELVVAAEHETQCAGNFRQGALVSDQSIELRRATDAALPSTGPVSGWASHPQVFGELRGSFFGLSYISLIKRVI
jgi:hypothetical protein